LNNIFFRRNFSALIAAVALLSLVVSCKPQEKAHRGTLPLFDRSTGYLFNKMRANEFDYDWITAKFSADLTEGGKKNSFKATYRAKKDSVIWITISPSIGMELLRAIMTRDSIMFMNKFNSTYFIGDYKYLSNNFGIEVDFDMIQSTLTGNAFASFEEEEFRSSVDKDHYLLSTIRKRKLRRSIQRNDSLDVIAQSIWLEPRIYKIGRFGIYDFAANRNLEIIYDNFTPVGEQLFPFKLFLQLTGSMPVQMNIVYSKVAHDTPQNLPFTIPEKYERVQ
jgi:hypothetical protein